MHVCITMPVEGSSKNTIGGFPIKAKPTHNLRLLPPITTRKGKLKCLLSCDDIVSCSIFWLYQNNLHKVYLQFHFVAQVFESMYSHIHALPTLSLL